MVPEEVKEDAGASDAALPLSELCVPVLSEPVPAVVPAASDVPTVSLVSGAADSLGSVVSVSGDVLVSLCVGVVLVPVVLVELELLEHPAATTAIRDMVMSNTRIRFFIALVVLLFVASDSTGRSHKPSVA